jgi:hypothetical protein
MSRSNLVSAALLASLASLASLTSLTSLAALAGGCGTSDAAAPAPAAPARSQPASTGDARALCVQVFAHNRTCTAQYIPALVDLRARYDVPAGIAAEVAADRGAVIAQANQEWAVDSTDAAIDVTCASVAASTSIDPADAAGAQACLALADCAAYTTCIMPYFEKRFAK